MWTKAKRSQGFTLVEVLAALLFMAVLIPVTMQGVTVSSRAGIMAQRKSTAMRIAERVIDEEIFTGRIDTGASYGTILDGDTNYPWVLRTEPWTEDTMTKVTVEVSFDVQGNTFNVSANTLYDPAAETPPATATTVTATTPAP